MAEVGGGVRKCWNCGQPTTDNDLRVCNDPICGQAAISLRERTIGQEQSMWDRISRKEITLCETCDAFFDYIPQKVFCDECLTNRRREYSRRPEVKAKKREYDRLPETRAKVLERQRTPENKAKAKAKALERQRTPEYKAKVSERMREYNKRPEVKERKRENARKYYLRNKKSSLSAEDDLPDWVDHFLPGPNMNPHDDSGYDEPYVQCRSNYDCPDPARTGPFTYSGGYIGKVTACRGCWQDILDHYEEEFQGAVEEDDGGDFDFEDPTDSDSFREEWAAEDHTIDDLDDESLMIRMENLAERMDAIVQRIGSYPDAERDPEYLRLVEQHIAYARVLASRHGFGAEGGDLEVCGNCKTTREERSVLPHRLSRGETKTTRKLGLCYDCDSCYDCCGLFCEPDDVRDDHGFEADSNPVSSVAAGTTDALNDFANSRDNDDKFYFIGGLVGGLAIAVLGNIISDRLQDVYFPHWWDNRGGSSS